MKYLITGGAGFIGTNLTLDLISHRHEVVIVDNLITGDARNLNLYRGNKRLLVLRGDITRPIPKLINKIKFDEIYHLACPTGVPNLTKLAKEMLMTNSLGTSEIVNIALKSKAKLLFTSSSEVYGDPRVYPQRENYTGNVNPIGVRSPYEEGKRFAESLISTYTRLYGLKGYIVRVFNTFGPYMNLTDTRVIPAFIYAIINNKSIPVAGDGKQKRTFCYVDDLVAGMKLVMQKGRAGEVYNIGGTQEISVIELAKLVKKIAKSKVDIRHIDRPKHDHQRRKPDVSKVNTLGWKQKITLERGLIRTLEFYNSPGIAI